jgi:DNA-binding transcriptional ArsR family regulator
LIQIKELHSTLGFVGKSVNKTRNIGFDDLWKIYETTPGLVEDKLKATLLVTARTLDVVGMPDGIVIAYDEAQNLSDHRATNEFPLSMLLDVFSYLQRQGLRSKFFLLLCGLPTLLPKLNEARTYTERMFHTVRLQRLPTEAARDAILKPIEIAQSPLKFDEPVVEDIVSMSGGYPYFIQFICKEIFDAWIGKVKAGKRATIPRAEIVAKLDEDFFAGRWLRATDRQQEFLQIIASLDNCEEEFSVNEIVTQSRARLRKGFSPSHATQILHALTEKGLVYKSRRGNYMLAVPLMSNFIKRQPWSSSRSGRGQ